MTLIESLLAGGLGVLIIVGLKVAMLYQWHRNGMRWPDEDLETYIEHSPRFQDGEDTWTGMTTEEYRDFREGHGHD